jgi:hypothetical protein
MKGGDLSMEIQEARTRFKDVKIEEREIRAGIPDCEALEGKKIVIATFGKS